MLLVFTRAVFPAGAHGHRVFTDGDANAECGAELHADGFDGVVKVGVFAGLACGDHPVGGELDVADLADVGRGDIGQTLADRNAARCGGVEDRNRCAFANGHRFAGVAVHTGRGDRDVSDGCLPRADHLIAGDHAGDTAIGDGDEEILIRDGWEAEHAVDGVA